MLTRKKIEFIKYYIRTLNASESARLAGYSRRTARSQGSRLLTDVDVKYEIDKGIKLLSRENKISKENVLKKLWDIANNDRAKENDRIRALEVVSKINKYHKDNDTNKIAIFQQIAEGALEPKEKKSIKENDLYRSNIPRDRSMVVIKHE